MPKIKYIIYLALADGEHEGDPKYLQRLAKCRALAGSRLQQECFQRDGTRHISLKEVKLTEEEAAAVYLETSLEFPLKLKVTGLLNWPMCLALGLESGSRKALNTAVKLAGFPEGISGEISGKTLHLSLYRKRNYGKGVKTAMNELRNKPLVKNTDWGCVNGVRICIKKFGADYETGRTLNAIDNNDESALEPPKKRQKKLFTNEDKQNCSNNCNDTDKEKTDRLDVLETNIRHEIAKVFNKVDYGLIIKWANEAEELTRDLY